MPEKYCPSEPLPCPDCGELHSEFFDSIAGWLCASCYRRLTTAAAQLLTICQRRAQRKAAN